MALHEIRLKIFAQHIEVISLSIYLLLQIRPKLLKIPSKSTTLSPVRCPGRQNALSPALGEAFRAVCFRMRLLGSSRGQGRRGECEWEWQDLHNIFANWNIC